MITFIMKVSISIQKFSVKTHFDEEMMRVIEAVKELVAERPVLWVATEEVGELQFEADVSAARHQVVKEFAIDFELVKKRRDYRACD